MFWTSPSWIGVAIVAVLMVVVSNWALAIRERHPERYTGAARWWGNMIKQRRFAVAYAVTMLVTATIIVTVRGSQ
jgi:hypothetical protein